MRFVDQVLVDVVVVVYVVVCPPNIPLYKHQILSKGNLCGILLLHLTMC
jgi:hypothetical protein